MNFYCVVCKNGTTTFEEIELVKALVWDKTLNNRFPSEDQTSELYGLEVFKKGTRAECEQYLNDIPEQIRYLFSVELVDADAMKLI
jgi:hypothetical protein